MHAVPSAVSIYFCCDHDLPASDSDFNDITPYIQYVGQHRNTTDPVIYSVHDVGIYMVIVQNEGCRCITVHTLAIDAQQCRLTAYVSCSLLITKS